MAGKKFSLQKIALVILSLQVLQNTTTWLHSYEPLLTTTDTTNAPESYARDIFTPGIWTGFIGIDKGKEAFAIRISTPPPLHSFSSTALIDLPDRKIYGYPVFVIGKSDTTLSLLFIDDYPFPGILQLQADTLAEDTAGIVKGTGFLFANGYKVGTISQGMFSLSRKVEEDPPFLLATNAGMIYGSLSLPEMDGPWPLLLILSDSGFMDRDGNNPSVPGKSDSLKLISQGLAKLGIASVRYDKRGAGESYLLAPDEKELRFQDFIDDAKKAIVLLGQDLRFSSLYVMGYGEGALVASYAISELSYTLPDICKGLVFLAASPKSEKDIITRFIEEGPDEEKEEGRLIVERLAQGGVYKYPSVYYESYFNPDRQEYLASLFRYDIVSALKNITLPLLIIAGEDDRQVSAQDSQQFFTSILCKEYEKDKGTFALVPGMSHTLKQIRGGNQVSDEEFTNPLLPLAPDVLPILSQFIKENL